MCVSGHSCPLPLFLLLFSNAISRLEQLKGAIKEIDYQFDDILTVSGTGLVTRERLDGRDTLLSLASK